MLSRLIDQLKAAEAKLLETARTKYVHGYSSDAAAPIISTFDTKVDTSTIPLKDHNHEEELFLHGVKVVSSSNGNKSGSSDQQGGTESSPLVLLHGYMNASMMFYRNLTGLSEYFPTTYALDMLGWGLSSRPKFVLRDDKDSSKNGVSTAEDFFVESIESFRRQHDLPKITLAGHSMGGLVAAAYCERYPERVDRLILISPVGVPEQPSSSTSRFSFRRFAFRKLFEAGVTPGYALRTMSTTRGKGYVSSYVQHRLGSDIETDEERSALSDYLYYNNALPGSGEYCLQHLLTFNAYGLQPLVHRIPKLRVSNISFLYGENDWMDASGGLQVQKTCKDDGPTAPSVSVFQVKGTGHNIHVERYHRFNVAMAVAAGLTPKSASHGSESPREL